jgi:ABC-type polysaccharide/polyol phosphate export systems, permease component
VNKTITGNNDNSSHNPGNWSYTISPRKSFFNFNFKELWRYKDLIVLFVKRDFATQFKQTVLGPLWHIIQPIFTTIVFLLLFGKIANISTDGIPSVLFYLSGITMWNYFSTCLTATSNTFVTNAHIFGKVYFPRLVLPIAIVISNIAKFGIQFALLIAVMIYYHFNGFPIHIGWSIFLIPFLILLMAALGLGAGIIVSSLTTKYRDFTHLLVFGVQLMMYVTPVAYPISYIEGKSYKNIILLNPLSSIVEAFRFAVFNTGHLDPYFLGYSVLCTIAILVLGLMLFTRVESSFMDTV